MAFTSDFGGGSLQLTNDPTLDPYVPGVSTGFEGKDAGFQLASDPFKWVAPTGRTYDQIKDTPYLSDAERVWFLGHTPGASPIDLAAAIQDAVRPGLEAQQKLTAIAMLGQEQLDRQQQEADQRYANAQAQGGAQGEVPAETWPLLSAPGNAQAEGGPGRIATAQKGPLPGLFGTKQVYLPPRENPLATGFLKPAPALEDVSGAVGDIADFLFGKGPFEVPLPPTYGILPTLVNVKPRDVAESFVPKSGLDVALTGLGAEGAVEQAARAGQVIKNAGQRFATRAAEAGVSPEAVMSGRGAVGAAEPVVAGREVPKPEFRKTEISGAGGRRIEYIVDETATTPRYRIAKDGPGWTAERQTQTQFGMRSENIANSVSLPEARKAVSADFVRREPAPVPKAPPVSEGVPKPGEAPAGAGRPPVEPPKPPGEPPGGAPPLPPEPDISVITQAIKDAKGARPEQNAMFAAERARRTAIGASVLERGQGTGAQAFEQAQASMGGRFPRPRFEGITQDTTAFFDKINVNPELTYYEKINAGHALKDLSMGVIPQPADLEALARAFPEGGKELVSAVMDKRPLSQKVLTEIMGLLGLPQGMSTTLDASGELRQMAVLGAGNPREWLQASKGYFQSLATDSGFAATESRIRANPWFSPKGERAGLGIEENMHIFGKGRTVAAGERPAGFGGFNESKISTAIENLPGFKGSQRGYIAGLNELGANVYAKYADTMFRAGERDPDFFKALGKVVDHGRGYGSLNPGQIVPGVNTFFSGRNLVSKLDILMDPFRAPGALWKASPRQLAARNLAGFIAANGALLGMIGATGAGVGATVEVDPRSTDWGKIKIGNTRIDGWGGFAPMVRVTARAITGQTKTSTGSIMDTNAMDEILRFFRNKEAPVPALITDLLSGTNAIGQKVALSPERLADMFIPFMAQDVAEAYKNGNLPIAVVSGAASFFGLSSISYPPTPRTQTATNFDTYKSEALQQFPPAVADAIKDKSYNELTSAERRVVDDFLAQKDPKLAADLQKSRETSDSPLSLAHQKVDAAWQSYGPQLDSLYNSLFHGGDAATIKETYSDIKTKIQGVKDQAYSDPAYLKAKAELPASDAQKALDDYYSIYDKVVASKGYADFTLIDKVQVQYLQQLKDSDPALANRVAFSIQQGGQTNDNKLVQLYDAAKPTLDAYYAVPEKQRESWRAAHPKEDFTLWLLGYVGTVQSQAAASLAQQLTTDRIIKLR